MAGKPRTGSKYTYDAPAAFGESAMPAKAATARRNAVDPDIEDEDSFAADYHRQMAELDMHPGTEVKVCGYDDDRDLVLVEWTDRQGTTRITSVEPDHFADAFKIKKG